MKAAFMIRILLLLFTLTAILGSASVSRSPEQETMNHGLKEADEGWVQDCLSKLTLRQKIGQLIQIRVRGEFLNRENPRYTELVESIKTNEVGGVILFAGNVYESAHLLNELQARSNLPLLVSADFERGAAFRIEGATSFPWTMAVGATGSEDLAYRQGLVTARESRALGVHWIFAPVVDVNNNPDNPVINIRSFGEDPENVARLGASFIRGAREGGVLTTAKHFPGHGDTSVDTHIGLAVVPSDLERLYSVEFVPFISAINAGVDAVMTAHVAMPALTGTPKTPATLSSIILRDLLREQLRFPGLVVTDALEMGGIADTYWCGLAAAEAVKSGADVVLLPTDAKVAINEIERAVLRGDIDPKQIDASVARMLTAKSRLGLEKTRTVDISNLADAIASPASEELAQNIADLSITALRDRGHVLPVNPAEDPRVYSLVLDSGLDSSPGSAFQSEIRRYYPSAITEWANARITDNQADNIERQAKNSDLIICSTVARLSAGRDISHIPDEQHKIIQKLISTKKPMIWVLFGNPYVVKRFPEIGTCICTFSYSDVSQKAAAKAISGEMPVSGKMPVSIPGYVQTGDGLILPKLETGLRQASDEADYSSSFTFNKSLEIIDNYVKSGELSDLMLKVGHAGALVLDREYPPNSADANRSAASPGIRGSVDQSENAFGVLIASMLATDSGRLLLNAPVVDYLPEYKDAVFADESIARLLEDILAINKLQDGVRANLGLVQEIVIRTSGSADRLLRGLPVESFKADASPEAAPGQEGSLSVPFRDMPIYLQTLLNKGIFNHKRILKPSTITRFTSPGARIPALGWHKPLKGHWTDSVFSAGSFGFTNGNGFFVWTEPKMQLFIVLHSSTGRAAPSSSFDEAYEKICRSLIEEIKGR